MNSKLILLLLLLAALVAGAVYAMRNIRADVQPQQAALKEVVACE